MATRKYLALVFVASTTLTTLVGQPLMSSAAHAVPASPTANGVLTAQASPLDLVTGQLNASAQRIEQFALQLAQQHSPNNMSWNRAEANFDVRKGVLVVQLHGKAPAIIGDRSARLTINFKLKQNLAFEYDSFDLRLSRCGKLRPFCRKALRRARQRIDAALQANKATIEQEVNAEARQILGPIFQNLRP